MKAEYVKMIARNWAFITAAEQERIAQIRIAVAGCGMCSVVVEILARMGFQYFSVADGDRFDISNINRQACVYRDIGLNKAEVTSRNIRAINPDAQVRVYPNYITGEQEAVEFLQGADIAINAIDLGSNFLFFNRHAAKLRIPVIFPLNIGWGVRVLVFKPDSQSLEQLLGVAPEEVTEELLLMYIATHTELPDYLAALLPLVQQKVNPAVWPGDPQLGGTISINAGIIGAVAVQLALGKSVKTVPDIITYDAMSNISA